MAELAKDEGATLWTSVSGFWNTSVCGDGGHFRGRRLGDLLESCSQGLGLASVRLTMFSLTGSKIDLRSQFQEPQFILEGRTQGS